MDTLPLPPRPSLEQYRKRAKELVVAAKSDDPAAVRAWASDWLTNLARLLGVTEFTPFVQSSLDRAIEHIEKRAREGVFTLADAQYLIAEAHGFPNWGAFSRHLDGLAHRDAATEEFESAADAVVSGDIATLATLLRHNPGLIRERSSRVHRATLLHYIAANGVEDFRQKTPENAVEVARLLLDAGAEVDALAETYGGGSKQTTMNLLVSSAHPAGAGLQSKLAEVLVDYGAAINGVANDESPLMTALAFDYGDAAEALARRGARIDNIVTAAAIGRMDVVRQVVVDRETLASGVPLVQPGWYSIPNTAKAHIELGFVWACKFGHTDVVKFLLGLGVDPAMRHAEPMTALHWAAAHRHVDIVRLLLAYGAPLEVRNDWGGTVLSSTVWIAVHGPIEDRRAPTGVSYADVIEILLEAGADPRQVELPTGNEEIDERLLRLLAR